MGFDAPDPIAIERYEVDTPNQYYDGAIDEVHIYDRALIASEVAELFLAANN